MKILNQVSLARYFPGITEDREIKDVFPEDLTNKDTKFGPLKDDNQEGNKIE